LGASHVFSTALTKIRRTSQCTVFATYHAWLPVTLAFSGHRHSAVAGRKLHAFIDMELSGQAYSCPTYESQYIVANQP
jgi:hypothetical protein